MSKILKIAGGILAVIILVLLGIGFKNSGHYKISRSKDIAATSEQVFKVVADYNKWNVWSPWANLDPNQTISVTGQPLTVGHHFEWKGNDQVGSGNMTITEIKANEYVKEDLEFTAPQQSKCKTSLTLKTNGNKCNVTWEISGENGIVEGIFLGIMGGMDKMIGNDFEKGLNNLETAAAKEPITAPTPIVN